jgi:hypothetical protein
MGMDSRSFLRRKRHLGGQAEKRRVAGEVFKSVQPVVVSEGRRKPEPALLFTRDSMGSGMHQHFEFRRKLRSFRYQTLIGKTSSSGARGLSSPARQGGA